MVFQIHTFNRFLPAYTGLKAKVAYEQNVANTQARDERLTVTLRACVFANG